MSSEQEQADGKGKGIGKGKNNKLRSAEKHRISTCRFADIVARVSIECYRANTPQNVLKLLQQQQTVLSTFLIFDETAVAATSFSNSVHLDTELDYAAPSFPLQAVAFGVGTKYMKYQDMLVDKDKRKVHDSHAEILAKRALSRFLLKEIIDIGDSKYLVRTKSGKFDLKPGLKLILYTSSAPCGNSVLKRWVKGQKEKYDASWDKTPFSFPRKDHEKIHIQSLEQGQIAQLVKKEDAPCEASESESKSKRELDANFSKTIDKHGPRVAPGTAQLNTGLGTILSCSDKIARWNLLGVQSKLLMHVFDNPLYISTIVVGRKFSRPHLRRALCCRLQDFSQSRFEDEITPEKNNFKLNHPTMLCTSVKLDNGVLTQTTNASFAAVECLSWTKTDSAADIIDGNIGVSLTQNDGIPLVAGATLAKLLHRINGDLEPSYFKLKERCDNLSLYSKIKKGMLKMKIYKFINDHDYAERYKNKKKQKVESSQ